MSRAGWSGGMLRASKLYQSVSISRPPATSNPRPRKKSITCSRVSFSGWSDPARTARPGSVTSIQPASSSRFMRVSRALASAASIAASAMDFRSLTRWPNFGRSSGRREPICFSSATISPFFPRKRVRKSATAWRLEVSSSASFALNCSRRVSIGLRSIAFLPRARARFRNLAIRGRGALPETGKGRRSSRRPFRILSARRRRTWPFRPRP